MDYSSKSMSIASNHEKKFKIKLMYYLFKVNISPIYNFRVGSTNETRIKLKLTYDI